MRLRNLLVGVRDIGALIGTPARRHLANQGSKTAEKGQSDAAQQGYQRTILHNKLQPSRNEMPEKWCFQGTSCEANSPPWKSRLGQSPSAPGSVMCPNCGAPMVRRMAKRGYRSGKRFWGCSQY